MQSYIKLGNVNEERINCFLNFIKPHLVGLKEEDTVLDVGCGSGVLANELQKTHKNIHLMDRHDQRLYCKGSIFHLTDVSKEKMPFGDNQVSLIIATQLLEHLENMTFFIDECYRVLQERGYIAISYPNFSNLMQRFYFLLRGKMIRLNGKIQSGGHINSPSFKFLIDWLSNRFLVKGIKGDFMVETIFLPRLIKLFKKGRNGKLLIFPGITSPLLSYNVMLIFQKRIIEK